MRQREIRSDKEGQREIKRDRDTQKETEREIERLYSPTLRW